MAPISNAVLEERLETTAEKVERHDHIIYGNGQEGILVKLDRIEQIVVKRNKLQLAIEVLIVVLLGLTKGSEYI